MNERMMERILAERERQFNLPGREFDVMHTPNDWLAVILSYVSEAATRNHLKPHRENFEDSLVKAAAVILAALEHCPMMTTHKKFADEITLDRPDTMT